MANFGNRFDKVPKRRRVALGRKGGKARVAKGRATIADPKERSEIARRAAMIRWHGKETEVKSE